MEGVELPIAELIKSRPRWCRPRRLRRPRPADRRPAHDPRLGPRAGERLVGPAHLDALRPRRDARGLVSLDHRPRRLERRWPSSAAGWCSRTWPGGWATPTSRAGSGSSWPSPGLTTASCTRATCPAGSCSAWSRTSPRFGPARGDDRGPRRGEGHAPALADRQLGAGEGRRPEGGPRRDRRRPGPLVDPGRDDHRHGRGAPAIRRPGLGRGAGAGRRRSAHRGDDHAGEGRCRRAVGPGRRIVEADRPRRRPGPVPATRPVGRNTATRTCRSRPRRTSRPTT